MSIGGSYPNVLGSGGPLLAGQAVAIIDQQISSLHRFYTVVIPANIVTSGAALDLGSASLPTGITRWAMTRAFIETLSVGGGLGLAAIDVRTAPSGGGTSVLNAATLLTGLTGSNLVQVLTPLAITSVQTATSLTLRQTINSLNIGSVQVVIELIDLS